MNKLSQLLTGLMIACLAIPMLGMAPSKDRENREWLFGVIREAQVKHKLPAMGVAFVSTEDLHAYATSGHRIANSHHGVGLEDQWHLGSCTKAMTATLAASLVDDGVLDWDLTLAEVYGADAVHPELREVTFQQLLGHRSGLPGNAHYEDLPVNQRPRARLEIAKTYVARKPQFQVGTFNYSNLGYLIAGSIMEQATRQSWEQLMTSRVFRPMGMRTAGFGSPATTMVNPPRAIYGHIAGQPTTHDNGSTIGPAGTVHASIADWAKFVQHHLKGSVGKSRYLDQEHFQKLHTPLSGPDVSNQALGWGVAQVNGSPLLQHAGSNNYWYCDAYLFPSEGYAILVTTNAGKAESAVAVQEVVQKVIAEKGRWIAPAKKPKGSGA